MQVVYNENEACEDIFIREWFGVSFIVLSKT